MQRLRADEQRRRCLSYFGFMDLRLWLRSGFYGTYEKWKRTGASTKVRVELSQELVIGGYTPGIHGFYAVLVGFYRGR